MSITCVTCNLSFGIEQYRPKDRAKEGVSCKVCLFKQSQNNTQLASQKATTKEPMKPAALREALKEHRESMEQDLRNEWYSAEAIAKRKEANKEAALRYRKANAHKVQARSMVKQKRKAGILQRPEECSRCGECKDVQGHHYDYHRPYLIDWLCKECHDYRHSPFGYPGEPSWAAYLREHLLVLTMREPYPLAVEPELIELAMSVEARHKVGFKR